MSTLVSKNFMYMIIALTLNLLIFFQEIIILLSIITIIFNTKF